MAPWPLLGGAGCAGCLAVCALLQGAGAASPPAPGPLRDAASLVQAATALHSHGHRAAGSAAGSAAGAVAAAVDAAAGRRWRPQVNCSEQPMACEEPFRCDALSPLEPLEWGWSGYAGGAEKTNPRAWCLALDYLPYMHQCLIKKDLVMAAQVQYEATQAGRFGALTSENDGSYCFLEGHCVDQNVTANTTLEEAEQLCDQRFGRERWTRSGSMRSPPEDKLGFGVPKMDAGFTHPEQTRPFLLAACAMGNYHCDVIYCKETYCKSPYYIDKYGHFLKDFGYVA